ncbi:protein-disulfide reductase DsbD [uncultured Endozoicomonas sp.]|uniref:protein-disulfide reductase DsbD n=1 Tax=uncultured Endozoicomonas sp. TaxID=432652 RepID=UPI00260C3B89|nr:protein-disulfide reductase DsbD [uncultured Endozoicomonas sp.]
MPKHPIRLIWTLLFALFLPWSAQANLDQLFGGQNQDFLPVEEAFSFSGTVENNTATINVQVTPEHYLYKHQFQFTPQSDISALGNATYPTSELIFDPYYNKNLETFSQNFTIQLPVTNAGTLPEVQVGFQGCAKAGLCYPPHSITIPLVAQNTGTMSTSAEQASSSQNSAPDSIYQQQLEGNSLPVALMLFILAGIGLSLTPCVLPMFPILSSLILGAKEQSKGRTIALTSTYVLTMSATFAVAGTLMGLFGASLNLQAKLQSPWLLIPMAILFVLLALSMFGLYEVQLPTKLREKLSGNQQQSGSLSGAAVMGMLSALVVSPCVSAPLAGALIYISSTGDALFGGLTLFALGLGMGIPLFVLALGGRHWLPKSGAWMNGIRSFFGVLLLGVAIWMLERIIPAPLTLLLWGALLIGSGIFAGALKLNTEAASQKLKQAVGILCLIYGTCLIVGGAMGNQDPLRPLASVTAQPPGSGNVSNSAPTSNFTKITTLKELDALLADAAIQQKPALVDVYADWCISCKVIERTVFPDPLVTDQLNQLTLIKLDITDNTREHQQYLNQNSLFGPPALLFFDGSGKEAPALKSQGEITAEQLHQKLTALLNRQT